MGYLFDTDAISELMRRRPSPVYVAWLTAIPREDQFTSAVTLGELYYGAFSSAPDLRRFEDIEARIVPSLNVLPVDLPVARLFGRIRAELRSAGTPLEDADLHIAATALHHGLELVTGNLRHFRRVPGLVLNPVLHDARTA